MRSWAEHGCALWWSPIGKVADSPSAFQPICLLDEAAKLFKIKSHHHPSTSTTDDIALTYQTVTEVTVWWVKANKLKLPLQTPNPGRDRTRPFLVRRGCLLGEVALAISLDMVNAPNYASRNFAYETSQSESIFMIGINEEYWREFTCGIPQESLLEPLLWNLVYDTS